MLNRRKNKSTLRAQSVVEFALVLPVLLLIIMGIVEFGRIFMTQQIVVNASREGARTGVLPSSTTSDVQAIVLNFLTSGGLSGPTSVQTTNVGQSVPAGSATSVNVQYTLSLLSGTIIPGLGDTINLSHTTVMRHE
ncbi:MAG TPA: TadE family protein [Planctomycetota bacterium]|nr:TadE family protein [Planctomycetota bacterium]